LIQVVISHAILNMHCKSTASWLSVLLFVALAAHACASRDLKGKMFERSANTLSKTICPWNKGKGATKKVDIEVGFWVGSCGELQLCDPGHYITSFELGTYGTPDAACMGPTGLINYCREANTRAPFGYIQGVCSDGKKLALYKASGAIPTTVVSSKQGFKSVNGTDVGTCCTLGGFMGCGVTHMLYQTQACPPGKRVAGYVIGAENMFDFEARKLVENTIAEMSYIGLVCRA
jgi:hypothetical protein